MKRIALSAFSLMLVAAALAPAAEAQVSVTSELGEEATFIELVRFNRDARNK